MDYTAENTLLPGANAQGSLVQYYSAGVLTDIKYVVGGSMKVSCAGTGCTFVFDFELSDGTVFTARCEGDFAVYLFVTNTKLAEAQTKLAEALSQKAAYEAELNSLKASQSALKAEKKAYKDAGLEKTYKMLNNTFKSLNATMGEAAKQMGITNPSSVKEAIQHPKQFEDFDSWMEQMGDG